jgi:hypothetical protein
VSGSFGSPSGWARKGESVSLEQFAYEDLKESVVPSRRGFVFEDSREDGDAGVPWLSP